MKKQYMYLELQFFAEADDLLDNPGIFATNQQQKAKQEQGEKNERRFTRAELGKIIAAQKVTWQQEHKSRIEEERNEAVRVARLSECQRNKEIEKRRLLDLEAREKKVVQAELRIKIQAELAESGLSKNFCDMVMSEKAEIIQRNIAAVKRVLANEVEKEVKKRLIQKPFKASNSDRGPTKVEINVITDPEMCQKIIVENKFLVEG